MEDRVIAWLAQQDIEAYLVGGCVRDWLLKHPIYDLDLAVDGDGLFLARRLANHFRGDYYPLDEARSTGRVILQVEGDRRLIVDVARFRGGDLAADLADRDFTINALAANVRTPDDIIDHHNGLADLEASLIRPVSDTSIGNDPLRALRAIRLAAQLGFALTPETGVCIRRDGAALAQVASERIRDELARLLALAHAAPGLNQLDDLGLLTTILPELEPLRNLEQPPPHHYSALTHTLETMRALESILGTKIWQQQAPSTIQFPISASRLEILHPFAVRLQAHLAQVMSDARPRLVTLKLAALLHDTGKPAARTEEEGRIRFIGHQQVGTKFAGQVLRRLRFSNAEVHLGKIIVRHHMRPLLLANQERVSARAVYRFFRDTGDAGVDVLLHALADHLATYAPGIEDDHWPRLLELVARMLADYWERPAERVTPPSLVDGNDLLREFGLQPGPHVGELLETVREAQVSGHIHTRGEALALVHRHLTKEE